MSLIGIWLLCPMTLWLYHPVWKKEVPHSGTFICRVLDASEEKVVIPLPIMLYVDCTKAIGWLDTDHPKKYWTRSCYEQI